MFPWEQSPDGFYCFSIYPVQHKAWLQNVIAEYFVFVHEVFLCCYPFVPLRNIHSCGSQSCALFLLQDTAERLCWAGSTGNLKSLSVLNHLMNAWMTKWCFCTFTSCCMPVKLWLIIPLNLMDRLFTMNDGIMNARFPQFKQCYFTWGVCFSVFVPAFPTGWKGMGVNWKKVMSCISMHQM